MFAPLLTVAETLVPEHAQRLKETFVSCTRSPGKNTQSESELKKVPTTVDELIKAASDAQSTLERTDYLVRATLLAVGNKDFEKAITILDSMDDDVKKTLGGAWDSWRWDYARSAACIYRKSEDFQAVHKVIDNTPQSLRPMVYIAFASECDALAPSEALEVAQSARSGMKYIEDSDSPQGSWFLSLVRLYEKLSPETTPAVLNEAMASINKTSKQKPDLCASATYEPTVLTHPIMFNQYKLPVSLLNLDYAGTVQAVAGLERSDIKIAFRLQLISAALTEQRKVFPKSSTP